MRGIPLEVALTFFVSPVPAIRFTCTMRYADTHTNEICLILLPSVLPLVSLFSSSPALWPWLVPEAKDCTDIRHIEPELQEPAQTDQNDDRVCECIAHYCSLPATICLAFGLALS